MEYIGIILNILTLGIVIVIVAVYRFIDRNNRSIDKVKRFVEKSIVEIDEAVEKNTEEMRNIALDIEVHKKAENELMNYVSSIEDKIVSKNQQIDVVFEKVNQYEKSMTEISVMTEKVDENIINLKGQSDFLSNLSKKIKEFDSKLINIEKQIPSIVTEFDKLGNDKLDVALSKIVQDFEVEKKEYMRFVEDLKEAAETDVNVARDNSETILLSRQKEIETSINNGKSEIEVLFKSKINELLSFTDVNKDKLKNVLIDLKEKLITEFIGIRDTSKEDIKKTQQDGIKVLNDTEKIILEKVTTKSNELEALMLSGKSEVSEAVTEIRSKVEDFYKQSAKFDTDRSKAAEATIKVIQDRGNKILDEVKNNCDVSIEGFDKVFKNKLNELKGMLDSITAQIDDKQVYYQNYCNKITSTISGDINRFSNQKDAVLTDFNSQKEKIETRYKKEIMDLVNLAKTKSDSYISVFDSKFETNRERLEKDVLLWSDKIKKDTSSLNGKVEELVGILDKKLEKFKQRVDEIEARYQQNVYNIIDRAKKLEDDIFESMKNEIEARASKSEKELSNYISTTYKKIELSNTEVLSMFGDMRSNINIEKEQAKKDLEDLKSIVDANVREFTVKNKEKLASIISDTDILKARYKDDFETYVNKVNASLDSLSTKVNDEVLASSKVLSENSQKITSMYSDLEEQGVALINSVKVKFDEGSDQLEKVLALRLKNLEDTFNSYRETFDFKVNQIEKIGKELDEVGAVLKDSMSQETNKIKKEFVDFEKELNQRKTEEVAKVKETFDSFNASLLHIEKEIEALKANSYEKATKRMNIYEDEFFADLKTKTDVLNNKVSEWQNKVEKDMEKIAGDSRKKQSELEKERSLELSKKLSLMQVNADDEFAKLTTLLNNVKDKVTTDLTSSQNEIESFKETIKRSLISVEESSKDTFNSEFVKLNNSLLARVVAVEKESGEKIEIIREKLNETTENLSKKFDVSYGDVKLMQSNILQQMKETEADLKMKYVDLKNSAVENIGEIKAFYVKQKDDIMDKSHKEVDDMSKQILVLGQDVDRLIKELKTRSESNFSELGKKYEDIFSEFSIKSDSLLNDLEFKSRDFKQISTDVKEKVDAVQSKLHKDIDEERKELVSKLDFISKRIKDFETSTKIFDQAEILKAKLNEDIETLRAELDRILIQKREIKDVDLTFQKIKALEEEVSAKMTFLQANKKNVEELEKDFKKYKEISTEINAKIDRVTASNDIIIAVQSRLKDLDTLEQKVSNQFSRLEQKSHIIDHATEGIDSNFEAIEKLEDKIKDFDSNFAEFITKLNKTSQRVDSLANNKEKADIAVDKLLTLDSTMNDIDNKIDSMQKAREWLAEVETRLIKINSSASEQLEILNDLVKNGDNTKTTDDFKTLVKQLSHQGWSKQEIAKKLKISLSEVELVLEMNSTKKSTKK